MGLSFNSKETMRLGSTTVFLFLVLVGAGAWSSPIGVEPVAGAIGTEFSSPMMTKELKGPTTKNPLMMASEFRRIFKSLMPADSTDAQKQDLIFQLDRGGEWMASPLLADETAEEFLERTRTRTPSPKDLEPLRAGTEPLRLGTEPLRVGTEPPLIIIIPGIFGEFIKDHPFQDLIDEAESKPSNFKKEFQKRFNARSSDDFNKYDYRFQLAQLSYTQWMGAKTDEREFIGHWAKFLTESILIGVLRDEKGEVLANTLTLDTKALSLESLGDLRSNARMFNRRLSKFFNILGSVPKNIIMVGYSRGAAIGLDMLALGESFDCIPKEVFGKKGMESGCTEASSKSWIKNVRGFLSVGGVIYGSEVADAAFPFWGRNTDNKKMPFLSRRPLDYLSQSENLQGAEKVIALGELASSLSFIDESKLDQSSLGGIFVDATNKAIMENNNRLWKKFLFRFVEIQSQILGRDLSKLWEDFVSGRLTQEGLVQKVEEMQSQLQTDLKIDMNAAIAQGISIMQKGFGKVSYNSNILQFKKLVEKTLAAAMDLTTVSRLSWWSQNKIPTDNIKYYSISASMAPSDQPNLVNKDLSRYSYNFDTVDFQNLFGSYQSFFRMGDFKNNDSQVGWHKSIFYPQLAQRLNPRQGPFKADVLCLFHTHHWGLALRAVTPVKQDSGQQQEPFPRKGLLTASLAIMYQDPDLKF